MSSSGILPDMGSAQDKSRQAKQQARRGAGKGGGQFVPQGGPRAAPAPVHKIDLSTGTTGAPEKSWANGLKAYEQYQWAKSDDVKIKLKRAIDDTYPDATEALLSALAALNHAAMGSYMSSGGVMKDPRGERRPGVWSSDLEFAELTMDHAERAMMTWLDMGSNSGEELPPSVMYPDDLLHSIRKDWEASISDYIKKKHIQANIKNINWNYEDNEHDGPEVEIISAAYPAKGLGYLSRTIGTIDPISKGITCPDQPIKIRNDDLGIEISVAYSTLDWRDGERLSEPPARDYTDDDYMMAFVSIKTNCLNGTEKQCIPKIEEINADGDGPNAENSEALIIQHLKTNMDEVLLIIPFGIQYNLR